MITAASAAAQKLGYSTLKAKQMDVVVGIVSEHDVFTTLITRYGKCLSYGRLLYTYDEALFIFSSQVCSIASLQLRPNGDSVAIAAHV